MKSKSYYYENYETIDGIKGRWLTVTKLSEVTSGQRVRYSGTVTNFGYTEAEHIQVEADRTVSVYWGDEKVDGNLFSGFWKNIQVFFPSLPVEHFKVKKIAKKIAKVDVHHNDSKHFWFDTKIGEVHCIHRAYYTSRKSAIKGAQRFCKNIDYECEILK